MRKLLFCCLCITIFLNSCEFSKKSSGLENSYLTKIKSMQLPLDEKSTYEFFMYQVVAGSLLVLNQVNYSLDIYNLSEEKLIGRIQVEKEGLNGLERLNSFYYHNQDSIFFFPQFQLKNSILADINGNVVNRIQHEDFNIDIGDLINHVGTPSISTILFDDELHFSVFPLQEASIEDNNFITEHSLNLTSGIFTSYKYINKPDFLHNKRWVSETFSRVKTNKEEWYFSWNLSDTVYHILGKDNGLEATSPMVMNGGIVTTQKPIQKNSSAFESNEITFESYIYGKILVDEKNKKIHRIRYLPTTMPVSIKNPYLQKDFEILSYQLGGEFLGSTGFKSGIYDPRLVFLGPDGIYFPKTNPEYDDLNEDKIVYDVFNMD